MRDLKKAEPLRARAATEKVELDIRQLDVCDDASVSACVQAVLAKYGRIDVLVNNAGAGYLGSLEQTSIEQLRDTFEVNFVGIWRTSQAVLPSMRAARSGHIINVTSIGGLIGQPFNDAYCAAKFAVEGMTESMAPVLATLGVRVSLIEPGPVATEFVNNVLAKPGAENAEVSAVYQPMIQKYIASFQGRIASISQSGDEVAQTILTAATDETPHLRYATSDMVKQLASLKYTDITGDIVPRTTGAQFRE
jgi:NAD(P)-dependent dehydrogenase (short-subunit alcohol dehydrogenase family)